jgi:type I restriction enzyme, R subunit
LLAEAPRLLRFQKFSERVQEVLDRFEQLQLTAAEALAEYEAIAKDLQEEENAHEGAGLTAGAYGVLTILESFPAEVVAEGDLKKDLAEELDGYYASEDNAPVGWHLKDELRQQVRLRAHEAGFSGDTLKALPDAVEDFALKHHIRVS